MKKSKLGRVFLAAVLALTLGASAALAVDPSPIESYRDGTVTFQISFDLEATDGLVTNAKAGKSQASTPYAPEFTGLTAYTAGINGTLKEFVEAATKVSEIPSGDVFTNTAIVELMGRSALYGVLFKNEKLQQFAKDLAMATGEDKVITELSNLMDQTATAKIFGAAEA